MHLGTSVASADTAPVKQEVKKETVHKQGPFDLAVANEEKLIEMLKESGKISKNASAKEAEQALEVFLKEKSESLKEKDSSGELEDEKLELEANIKDKLKNDYSKKAKDKGKKGGKKLDKVVEEDYHGNVRSDNVLVLLVEFPDFPHNSIQPGESDMYYQDYVKEHYQNMIFGENGYKGPNGENLISMKQFYEEQSDGAYTVNGKVAGWYMASKNAAEYGGNYPTEDDSDVNARGLVKEALTAAAADPSVNLAEYDQEDRYDLDGDGNFREARWTC